MSSTNQRFFCASPNSNLRYHWTVNESLLVNTLGHSAGVLIFGIFLYLLIQDRPRQRRPGGNKPVIAAALAIVWNLASLFALRPGSGDGLIQALAVAVGFSVLS